MDDDMKVLYESETNDINVYGINCDHEKDLNIREKDIKNTTLCFKNCNFDTNVSNEIFITLRSGLSNCNIIISNINSTTSSIHIYYIPDTLILYVTDIKNIDMTENKNDTFIIDENKQKKQLHILIIDDDYYYKFIKNDKLKIKYDELPKLINEIFDFVINEEKKDEEEEKKDEEEEKKDEEEINNIENNAITLTKENFNNGYICGCYNYILLYDCNNDESSIIINNHNNIHMSFNNCEFDECDIISNITINEEHFLEISNINFSTNTYIIDIKDNNLIISNPYSTDINKIFEISIKEDSSIYYDDKQLNIIKHGVENLYHKKYMVNFYINYNNINNQILKNEIINELYMMCENLEDNDYNKYDLITLIESDINELESLKGLNGYDPIDNINKEIIEKIRKIENQNYLSGSNKNKILSLLKMALTYKENQPSSRFSPSSNSDSDFDYFFLQEQEEELKKKFKTKGGMDSYQNRKSSFLTIFQKL